MTRHVTFVFEYETKGAARYIELGADNRPIDPRKIDDQGGLIGTIYLRKKQVKNLPEQFTIVVNV